ncbi:MAG TPA: hypothetical protein VLA76_02825 [Candidatus Angelobacter sp.]|nr:hypothetical protein [Candidatus Angelobacter sp.]
MSAPAWAGALVRSVCAESGVTPPRLAWRRRAGTHSTGVARRGDGSITVRAGTDSLDQRLTLLHELAHWLTPAPRPRRGQRTTHHGIDFYRTAFDLYRRHGIPDAEALRLESARYVSSLRHAVALAVPGAASLLDGRRAALRARPRRRWRVAVPEHAVTLRRDDRWHVCATCGQRLVGRTLSRARSARRALRHVLYVAEPVGVEG